MNPAQTSTGRHSSDGAAFLAALHQSNLLRGHDADALRTILADVPPNQAAARLVERRLLTAWQARMLRAGHHRFFLGRYKLLDEIGRGGMGAVFKAEQAPLGRIVALKVIRREFLTKPTAVARFRREIQAAAALNHPHIVCAFDADSVQDAHFLVMEFVDGEDLAEVRREGPLPIGLVCELIRQAALGLQYAHERGMVHRDIKPSNLLLTWRDGRPCVKILDFGLARFTSEQTDVDALTATGDVVGTPDYIAPEQARSTRTADIRSDIYSLGLSLYQLIVGEAPFCGQNAIEKIMARFEQDVPSLRETRGDVSAELDAILAKMTARRPDQRYQTPGDVASALEPFADNTVVSGTIRVPPVASAGVDSDTAALAPTEQLPPEQVSDPAPRAAFDQFLHQLETEATIEPVTPTAKGTAPAAVTPLQQAIARRAQRDQKQVRSVLAGLLLALAGLACCGAWWKLGETRLVLDWPEAERAGATLTVDGYDCAVPDEGLLVFAGRPGARNLRLTRDGYEPISKDWTLGRRETATFRPEWTPTTETIRRQEWEVIEQEVAKRLDSGAIELNESLAWIKRIQHFRRQWIGMPDVVATCQSLISRLLVPADELRREAIDPRALAMAGGGNADDAPAELVGILGDGMLRHWNGVISVVFSPDGGTIVSSGSDQVTLFWDAATGRLLSRADDDGSAGLRLRTIFSPDGRSLATFGYRGGVAVRERDTQRLRFQLSGDVDSFAFSPDGATLAAGVRDRGIELFDVETGAMQHRLDGHAGLVRSIRFSPAGGVLASGGDDGTVRVWNAADGSERITLQHSQARQRAVDCVAFNSAGTLLVSGSNESIRLWNLATGELRTTMQSPAGHAAFYPDGSALVTADNKAVKFWDPATGERTATLTSLQAPGSECVRPECG